ncbi:MAG: hypothetical protein WA733_23390 [Methylocystis sp.]
MTAISCSREIFAGTIACLRRGGLRGEERAVLWLAKTAAEEPPAVVCQVYEPEQIAAKDFFHLPPESMRALMMHLRTKRLKVVAQIHTHPGAAFHSDADNEWAIVRHRGALSLVFPRALSEHADSIKDSI